MQGLQVIYCRDCKKHTDWRWDAWPAICPKCESTQPQWSHVAPLLEQVLTRDDRAWLESMKMAVR